MDPSNPLKGCGVHIADLFDDYVMSRSFESLHLSCWTLVRTTKPTPGPVDNQCNAHFIVSVTAMCKTG